MAGDDAFVLSNDGYLRWQGEPLAGFWRARRSSLRSFASCPTSS